MAKVKEKKLTKSEIIKRLNNDDDYYGDFGRQYLSNSDIKDLLEDPKEFKQPKPMESNLLYGQAFHDAIMFGKSKHFDEAVESSTRTTKIYKEVEAEKGQMVLLQKEVDDIIELYQAGIDNKIVRELLEREDIQFEVPMIAEMTENNILWKGKADIVTEDAIYDIKTSSNAGSFLSSSRTWNYDSQAYIYSYMFQKPMIFLVFDKKKKTVHQFDVSDETYERGYDKVQRAEQEYLDYFVNKTKKLKDRITYGTI